MRKYFLPLCLAACGWAPPLLAPAQAQTEVEPAAPLTLQAALSLALAAGAHPGLSAARNELLAADGAVLQAGLPPNPSLSLERLDTRRDTRETTIVLSQPLELGGKRQARLRVAERERDGAAAALAVRQAELRADTMAAFFAVLAAQEQLRLAREAAQLAQSASGATARRVAAGKVSPVEETRARVAEGGVKLELLRAASALATARQRLAALWGNPSPRFERAEGVLPGGAVLPGSPPGSAPPLASSALSALAVLSESPQLPELPELAVLRGRLAQAPALSQAHSEVARRQALAALELARRAPDLTFSVGGKRSEELGRTQAVFGVSLPLPLFDRNQGAVLETARRADRARDELAATRLRLEGELAQAHETFTLARQQAQALRDEILPGAHSAYAAASTGFEFGKFGFLDVLDAQRTLLQAQSHYLTTLAEAYRALADIARIVGEQ